MKNKRLATIDNATGKVVHLSSPMDEFDAEDLRRENEMIASYDDPEGVYSYEVVCAYGKGPEDAEKELAAKKNRAAVDAAAAKALAQVNKNVAAMKAALYSEAAEISKAQPLDLLALLLGEAVPEAA